MAAARAHLLIHGQVQGVFYRAFTRNLAVKEGLHGWVRTLYDGRVEAVFEGERGAIEQAIRECRKGSPGARVTNVEVAWEDYSEEWKGFEIKY
jgi:acylphosphatase